MKARKRRTMLLGNAFVNKNINIEKIGEFL